MKLNQIPEKITKEYVFSLISEEEIFFKYLNIKPDLINHFINPLRNDDDAGCSFFIRYDKRLIFNDWAWKQFDCIDIVQQIYNVSYYKALEIILNDYQNSVNPVIDKLLIDKRLKKKVNIRVKRKRFKEHDLNFWTIGGKVDVTVEELNNNKIYNLDCFWINGNLFNNVNQLMFVYHFYGYKYQLYFPNGYNNQKFFSPSKIKYGDLEFIDVNSNYVVITKSKKDSFYLRHFGINSFFIINEKVILSDEIMDSLSHMTVWTLFDNDMTGKRLSVKYSRLFSTRPILMESTDKDFTGFLKNKTIDEIKKTVDYFKKYNDTVNI